MWDSCVMTWKTFLNLFKKDYSLFTYEYNRWCFKCGVGTFNNIPIFLKLSNDTINDGVIAFFNRMQSTMTFLEEGDLNGILQTKVQ